MTFTAQELNHRLELQHSTTTQDEAGGVIYVWTTFAVVYARMDPLLGREFFAAAAVNSEQDIKFTMRYQPDLKATDRLVHEGMAYDVTAVQHVRGRHRETLVMGKIING